MSKRLAALSVLIATALQQGRQLRKSRTPAVFVRLLFLVQSSVSTTETLAVMGRTCLSRER